jgi:hypothetical protein
MAKLPLGKCPACAHEIWDNAADLGNAKLADVWMVCVYCACPIQYDVCAGSYVRLDASRLSNEDKLVVSRAVVMARLRGRQIEADERAQRRQARKLS